MPYKEKIDLQKHNKKYYRKNRKKILLKQKLSIEKRRKNWRVQYQKKKDQIRKGKIKSGQIYKSRFNQDKPKVAFSHRVKQLLDL